MIQNLYIVPGQPHILLAPEKNSGWASLRASYEAIGREIERSGAELLLVYSTQWFSVIGHLMQTDPKPKWVRGCRGSSSRATRAQREDVQRILDQWSQNVARYTEAMSRLEAQEGWLYDPLGEKDFSVALLVAFARHRRFRGESGELLTWTAPEKTM